MRLTGIALIALVVVLDQLSKWGVTEHLFRAQLTLGDPMRLIDWLTQAPQMLPPVSIALTSFFSLSMAWNTGISWGLFAGSGTSLLTLATLGVAAFFLIWMLRTYIMVEIVALAMIVGGALGNIIDRTRFGAVIDFFDFHWGDWHFPAFNVADSAISAGVAILLIHSLFFAKKTL